MNPAIILILLIAAVVGWFLSAGIYKTVGEHIKDVVDTAVDEMADDENDIEVNIKMEREDTE